MPQYMITVNVPHTSVPHSPKQVADAVALGVQSLGTGPVAVTLDPTERIGNESPPTVQIIKTIDMENGFVELPDVISVTMEQLGVDLLAGEVRYRSAAMDHPDLGGLAVLCTDWTGPKGRYQVAIVLDALHMRKLARNLMSCANSAANKADEVERHAARKRPR